MDERTLKALRASIHHWEENASVEDLTQACIGSAYCSLCREFNKVSGNCRGCPVSMKTGISGCRRTPYEAAADAYLDNKLDDFRAAALEEISFLKELLPKELVE